MPGGLSSLDAVAEEAVRARAEQQTHFDSLDAKAGVAVGFAGVLVAVAPDVGNLSQDLGRLLAVIAAVLGLLAAWPRLQPIPEMKLVRAKFLTSEATFTKVSLLDLRVAMIERASRVLAIKARLLQGASAALTSSILLIGIGRGVG